MPMTRVALKQGKSADYKRALLDNIYLAMRETFKCPEDDQFMVITEHDDSTFCYNPSYLGVARTDDLVMVQITCNFGRTVEMKKALYQRMAELLEQTIGLRRDDLLISVVEVAKENWSLGNGEAQYA